jgi:hypothetical protein
MRVFLAQGTNHSHTDQLCIKILDGIGILGTCRTEFLDLGHAIFNPGNEGAQGLFRLLPDGEEVVPGVEAHPRMLLEVYGSKGGPNLHRIILDSVYVHPLLHRASQIQLPSCLVCLDIPLGLKISVRGRTSFRAIDQQPEALDMKSKESIVLADIQHRELGKMKGQAREALGLSQDAKSAKMTHCGLPTGTRAQSTHRFSISRPTESPECH